MRRSAFHLFFLRKLDWPDFDFPRWQALAVIVLWGISLVFKIPTRAVSPDSSLTPAMGLGIALFCCALVTLVYFATTLAFMRWWMRRDGRWDGRGNIFNLLVVSTVVIDLLCLGLAAIGTPVALLVALQLYAIWVAGSALSRVIPQASRSYGMGGIVMSRLAFLAAIAVSLLLLCVVFTLASAVWR